MVASAVEAAAGGPVTADHLPHEMRVRANLPPRERPEPDLRRDPILRDVERRLIAYWR